MSLHELNLEHGLVAVDMVVYILVDLMLQELVELVVVEMELQVAIPTGREDKTKTDRLTPEVVEESNQEMVDLEL